MTLTFKRMATGGSFSPGRLAAERDELIEQKEFWDVFTHGLSSLSARTATAFILRESIVSIPMNLRSS